MNLDNLKLALRAYHSAKGFFTRKGDKGDVMHGKVSFTAGAVLVSGAASFSISELTLGSYTLVELGRIYRYYRFNRVEIEFPAPQWTTASMLFASYSPSAESNAVTYVTDESAYSMIQSSNSTVPAKLVIPRKAINPQMKWLLTTADGTDPNLSETGTVNFSSLVSSNETIDVKFTIDFSFKTIQDPTEIGPMLSKFLARSEKVRTPGSNLLLRDSYRKDAKRRGKELQENSNNSEK
jgi:hypothetical protein